MTGYMKRSIIAYGLRLNTDTVNVLVLQGTVAMSSNVQVACVLLAQESGKQRCLRSTSPSQAHHRGSNGAFLIAFNTRGRSKHCTALVKL